MSHLQLDLVMSLVLQALWDAGLRVTPRNQTDPFDIHPSLVPGGWSYEWQNVDGPKDGWQSVLHQDHPGWFAPLGKTGRVEVDGLRLMKKFGDEAAAERKRALKRSHDQLERWADKFGAFVGGATMLQTDGEEVVRTSIVAGKGVEVSTEKFERPATKTVELTTKIPKDMLAYIDPIFAERDRIVAELLTEEDGRPRWRDDLAPQYQPIAKRFWEVVGADKAAPWWTTLHAIILPYAIDNVRKAVFQPNQSEAESTS